MTAAGSVTLYLERLEAGDRAALQALWERYFARLVGLARKKLRGAPRQCGDEEDAALSAFKSFWRGVEAGRFPRLDDRHDLWQVLVMLTLRKAANLARHDRAEKRGGGRVQSASAVEEPAEEEGGALAELIGREPDPAFAAEVAGECGRLLGLLPGDELRDVALWKMEGYSNQEIAAKLGRSVSRVECKLALIRDLWRKVGPA
jgi:DNA-directed RNA polymerase specialized sigma24 family protein